jgi:PAS domain S-box-containing protein
VDAVIASDLRGNIILFNKAAETIYGWSSQDVINKLHVTRLYPEEEVARDVMRKLRSGDHGGPGRLTTSRIEILSRTNERIPVNMTASIIYEGTREVATVGIFTDLRDRLNLER